MVIHIRFIALILFCSMEGIATVAAVTCRGGSSPLRRLLLLRLLRLLTAAMAHVVEVKRGNRSNRFTVVTTVLMLFQLLLDV